MPTGKLISRVCSPPCLQDDPARDALLQQSPQERVVAVRPLWQGLSRDERVQLLTVSLDELRQYAQLAAARLAKQQRETQEALQQHAGARDRRGWHRRSPDARGG